MEPTAKEVVFYEDESGDRPCEEWIDNLSDRRTRNIIDARLARVRQGNLGQFRTVGKGVLELKIQWGPGYRIYFGCDGDQIIVLLAAGDKDTQRQDIEDAHQRWEDWNA